MHTDTTRRSFLKAAPVAATAIALPGVALAASPTDPEWERIKADYVNATATVERGIERQTAAEEAWSESGQAAPTAEITYYAPGFQQGRVVVEGGERTESLTHINYRNRYFDPELKTHPAYLAFVKRVKAWRNNRRHRVARREYDAAWNALYDLQTEQGRIWQIAAAHPVSTVEQAREKIALLSPGTYDDGDLLGTLLRAVQADLARITAA